MIQTDVLTNGQRQSRKSWNTPKKQVSTSVNSDQKRVCMYVHAYIGKSLYFAFQLFKFGLECWNYLIVIRYILVRTYEDHLELSYKSHKLLCILLHYHAWLCMILHDFAWFCITTLHTIMPQGRTLNYACLDTIKKRLHSKDYYFASKFRNLLNAFPNIARDLNIDTTLPKLYKTKAYTVLIPNHLHKLVPLHPSICWWNQFGSAYQTKIQWL